MMSFPGNRIQATFPPRAGPVTGSCVAVRLEGRLGGSVLESECVFPVFFSPLSLLFAVKSKEGLFELQQQNMNK